MSLVRRFLSVPVVVLALLLTLAPSGAAAAPAGEGCTFDKGRSTCTTTQITTTVYPVNGGGNGPSSDGSPAAFFCLSLGYPATGSYYYDTSAQSGEFLITIRTTTTIVRRGMPGHNGPVLSQSSTEEIVEVTPSELILIACYGE